jgi:hypothetical protein
MLNNLILGSIVAHIIELMTELQPWMSQSTRSIIVFIVVVL